MFLLRRLVPLFACFLGSPHESGADEQAQKYSLTALEWKRFGKLDYQGGLLLTDTGALLGAVFRVRNNSKDAALILTKTADALPFDAIVIDDSDGRKLTPTKSPVIKRTKGRANRTEWKIPPQATEDYFIPVRELVDPAFNPESGRKFHVEVSPALLPKDTPRTIDYPLESFQFTGVTISRGGLAVDAHKAFDEALKTKR